MGERMRKKYKMGRKIEEGTRRLLAGMRIESKE